MARTPAQWHEEATSSGVPRMGIQEEAGCLFLLTLPLPHPQKADKGHHVSLPVASQDGNGHWFFFSHLIVFHIEEVQRGLGSSSQTILERNSMPDSQVSKYLWLARRDSVAVACCSHLGRSVHAETDAQRNQLSFLSGHLTLVSEAPAGLCFPCSRLGPPHFYLPNTNKPSAMYVKCYSKPEGGGELQNPSSRGNEWDFTTLQPMDTHIWWKKQNKKKVWKSRIVQALDSVLCQV